MAYIYQCNTCGTQVERPQEEMLTCAQCGQRMDLVATKRWLFRCHACNQTFEGTLTRGRSVFECPSCGGPVAPSRPV